MPLKEIDPFIDGPLVDEPSTRRVHARTDIWQGRIVAVAVEEVEVVEGSAPVTREYIIHPGAVAVVALRGEPGAEEILLERQYRHPVRANLWEIPAGLLDVEGEDYLAAAQRELAEETDLQAATWHVLTDYFNSPGAAPSQYVSSLRAISLPQGRSLNARMKRSIWSLRGVRWTRLLPLCLRGDSTILLLWRVFWLLRLPARAGGRICVPQTLRGCVKGSLGDFMA